METIKDYTTEGFTSIHSCGDTGSHLYYNDKTKVLVSEGSNDVNAIAAYLNANNVNYDLILDDEVETEWQIIIK